MTFCNCILPHANPDVCKACGRNEKPSEFNILKEREEFDKFFKEIISIKENKNKDKEDKKL